MFSEKFNPKFKCCVCYRLLSRAGLVFHQKSHVATRETQTDNDDLLPRKSDKYVFQVEQYVFLKLDKPDTINSYCRNDQSRKTCVFSVMLVRKRAILGPGLKATYVHTAS